MTLEQAYKHYENGIITIVKNGKIFLGSEVSE